MAWVIAYAEQIGAILVLAGLVISMFLGSPASKVPTGSFAIGETNDRQAAIHNWLTYIGPIVSAIGCLGYVVAAFN